MQPTTNTKVKTDDGQKVKKHRMPCSNISRCLPWYGRGGMQGSTCWPLSHMLLVLSVHIIFTSVGGLSSKASRSWFYVNELTSHKSSYMSKFPSNTNTGCHWTICLDCIGGNMWPASNVSFLQAIYKRKMQKTISRMNNLIDNSGSSPSSQEARY